MLIEFLPWLLAMLVLIAGSAFFSASEAALFSLRERDRAAMSVGNRSQQLAASLLSDSDRLLSAILFWNLVINMTYFAVASIVGFRLETDSRFGPSVAITFSAVALLAIIFLSEMLPKTLAVITSRSLSVLVAVPVAAAVRMADPIMPVLRLANLLSRRLIWPRFTPEPYLEVSDLERAIDLSTTDAELADHERTVLNNIVAMSNVRVDESMRPRTQFVAFRPPVSLKDLNGQMTPSGYLLVTEEDGEEIDAAIDLQRQIDLPEENLERLAKPILFMPWCATVADALQRMRQNEPDVVAIVNEFGETIGILTFEDILDSTLTKDPSRSFRLLNRKPVEVVEEGVWRVTGVASLRVIARHLGVEVPAGKSVTIGGVVQEILQRVPEVGDEGQWGPFTFRVVAVYRRGNLLVELRRTDDNVKEAVE